MAKIRNLLIGAFPPLQSCVFMISYLRLLGDLGRKERPICFGGGGMENVNMVLLCSDSYSFLTTRKRNVPKIL